MEYALDALEERRLPPLFLVNIAGHRSGCRLEVGCFLVPATVTAHPLAPSLPVAPPMSADHKKIGVAARPPRSVWLGVY